MAENMLFKCKLIFNLYTKLYKNDSEKFGLQVIWWTVCVISRMQMH